MYSVTTLSPSEFLKSKVLTSPCTSYITVLAFETPVSV